MIFINRLLITLISIGLLAVGFYTFGENGILNSFRKKTAETPFEKVEDKNKIPASALEDPVYTIDKKNSELIVRLFKAGVASVFAHDHIIRAYEFSGSIVFKKERPNLFKMITEVPTAYLIADSKEDRQKYNLSSLDENNRREINETMNGSNQLHVDKYPMIRFSSSALQKNSKNQYTITGNFTLHGTTKEIAVPVTITLEKNILNINGTFRFLQSDYGIKPYSAGWGTLRNKDEVLVLFDLSAKENK